MAWLSRVLKPALFLIYLVVALWAGYAVLGVYVVPRLIRTEALPRLGERLGGTLAAEDIRFDPFRFTLAITGLSLKGPGGRELAGCRELAVDLDLSRSLANFRPVLSGRLSAPVLRLERDSKGRIVPALAAGDGKPGLPFWLTRFEVEGGRLEFRDGFREKPYAVAFEPVNLTLEDVGPALDNPGRFRFSAKGDGGEAFAAEGSLSLAPLRSEGKLELGKLAPSVWLERLALAPPLTVRAGTLDLAADYSYREGEKPALRMPAVRIQGEALELAPPGSAEPGIKLSGLGLEGLGYSPDEGSVRLDSLSVAEIVHPAGRLAGLSARGLGYKAREQTASVESLALGPGSGLGSGFAAAEASGLVYALATGEAALDRLAVAEAISPFGKLRKAEAGGVRYFRATGEFKAETLALAEGESPRVKFASATLAGVAGSVPEQRFEAASLDLQQAAGEGSSAAALAMAGFSVRGGAQSFKLDSAKAEHVVLPWLKAGSAALGPASGSLKEKSLRLDSASLKDAVAIGVVEPDSQPPPPAPPKDAPGAPGRPGSGRVQPARYVPRAARIGKLELDEVLLSLPERKLSVDSVISERSELDLRLKRNGLVRVEGLPALPLVPPKASGRRDAWRVRVGEIHLAEYSVVVRDERVEPPVRLGFEPIVLKLRDFSSEKGGQFTYRLDAGVGERGKIEVDGQASLDPLRADLRFGIDRLWLRALQPYWQGSTGLELVRGRLNLWGDITLRDQPQGDLDYSGGAELVEFDLVDGRRREPFARWNMVKLDGLVFSNRPPRLGIRTVTSDQPYARVVVNEDRSLNLVRDLLPPDRRPAAQAALGSKRVTWPVVVGLMKIKGLKMDFSDLRLKPGFSAHVEDIGGTITGLSSKADATARVVLDGRINGRSPVRIFGQINPFQLRNHTDITLDFQGLNLTTLSGYSSKFAGFRIEKGKLDMTLRYRMHDGRLEVDNRLILDQLTLGEKVDNPEAPTLPVDLAVAVLKDAEGRIDFELPISGDLSNPSFSLASLYGEAIRQFFIKLVTSPMTLVANLTRSPGEDFGSIEFKPGDYNLSLAARERLDRLADALKLRPGLHLDVRGAADPQKDKLALADHALRVRLENDRREELRAKGTRVRSSVPIELSEEDYRRLFTRYYRLRHPPPAESEGERETPLLGAGLEQAKRKVLEEWPVSEMELRNLANSRSGSIRDWLVREGGLTDQRIYFLDVKLESTGEPTIKAALTLSPS